MIKREFVRFLFVGMLNTVFGYGLYLLLNLILSYKLAYTIAYLFGILFSYYLNTRLVFKTTMHWKSFITFPLVYLVQYLINLLFLHYLVEKLGLSEWSAPFVVIILSIPITFLLSRYVLKLSPPPSSEV